MQRINAQLKSLNITLNFLRAHEQKALGALHIAQDRNVPTAAKVSSVTLEPMRAFRMAKSAARTWKCTQLRVREQTLSTKEFVSDFRVTFYLASTLSGVWSSGPVQCVSMLC